MRFYQSKRLSDMLIQQGRIGQPNSSASRLPTGFWHAEFGCRPVRQKAFKKLISHGSSTLARQFSGIETPFSAVVRGIASRPSARLSGSARA
jgi:hypothetical protein